MILPQNNRSLSSQQSQSQQPLSVITHSLTHSGSVGRPAEGGLDAPAAVITVCGRSPMQPGHADCAASGRSPRQPFDGPGNVLAQIAYDTRHPAAAGDTAPLTTLHITSLIIGHHQGAPCPTSDAPNGSGASEASAGSEAAWRRTNLQTMLYNRQLRNYQRLDGGTPVSTPLPGKRGRLISLYRKLHVSSANEEPPPSASPSPGAAWMGVPPRADILAELAGRAAAAGRAGLAGRAAAAGGRPFERSQFFPNTVPRDVPDCLLFNVGQYPTAGRWGRLAASAKAARAAVTATPLASGPAPPNFAAVSSATFPRSAQHHWDTTRSMFSSVQQQCNSGMTLAGPSQSRRCGLIGAGDKVLADALLYIPAIVLSHQMPCS